MKDSKILLKFKFARFCYEDMIRVTIKLLIIENKTKSN